MRKFKKVFLSTAIFFSIALLLINYISPSSVFAQSTVGSWTQTSLTGVSVGSVVSDPTNANVLYAGTSNGVYKSTDKGDTWTATGNQGTDSSIVVISPSDHNTLYATKTGTHVQKSTNGGTSWTDVTNNFGSATVILDLAIDPTDANIVYAAPYGNCLGVKKTTDGGATWTGVGGGCDMFRMAIDPTNNNIVYSGTGVLIKSSDQGDNWTNPGNNGLGSVGAIHGIAIDPNNNTTIYIGTEVSGVYKSTDSGVNWTQLSNSPSVSIVDALAVSPLDSSVYAKSSSGVSMSTDGGDTWTAINSGSTPTSINRLIVPSGDPYDLFAATSTGLYVYGLQAQPSPTPSQTATIAVSPATGTKTVGTPFNVTVAVNSSAGAFNAAGATVAVSSNLTVTALHNATSNACNFQYTQTPTTSDPSFAGAIYGSSSSSCNVYTLTLTPNAAGAGTITFTNGKIKSYADSSEILTGVTNGSFTINNPGATPTPTSALSQLAVTSPLETYNTSYNLSGTKDSAITTVFVNGSTTGVIYPTSTTWQVTETLTIGNNAFTIYGSDGSNQTSTQNITVSRHTLGDINGDGSIDLTDASLFAVDYGKTSDLTYILSDMNGDGTADLTDLSILAKLETQ